MDLLFGEPVTKLSGNEFLQKNGYTFAQQVEEYFKQQGGMANSPFGEVILDKKGIQSSKQHGMSRIKASAFAAVKDVLEKGKVILDLDYYGTNNKSQRTGMIAAPIQIGNEKYVCVVEVIDNLKEQKLYVHEAFVGKTLQRAVASSLAHGSTTTSPNPNGEIAKVLQNHLNTYSDLTFLTNNGTFSALRDRNRAEQNKDNGWGNATQAEINWWKNKNIGENKQYKTNSNMNKKLIRLTESDLKQIVKESVSKLLKESYEDAFNDDFYNRIRPIQDGINAVNIEVTNKFRLNEYELTIHGSIQNNEIIFQLDNTAIIAGVDESFPCDWDEFQIITKHIYNHLKSIGIKMIGKPSLRKRRGDWVDEEMFAFMIAEMYIPNEYIEKGTENMRLDYEKGKAARTEREKRRAEYLKAKEEENRQKELERQKVLKRITKPSQEVQKQMDSMWDRQFGKRADLNSKKTKKRFELDNDNFGDDYSGGEGAAKEFYNRPNAAEYFKKNYTGKYY